MSVVMKNEKIAEEKAIDLMSELEYKPEYFMERGFSKKTIDEFGGGFYLPSDWVVHQRSLIPIHDRNNDLVGFLGRSIHPRDKWTGGFFPKKFRPEKGTGQWFTKWRSYPQRILGGSLRADLYNINRASRHIGESGSCVIVEGALDCWRVWETGVKNVVAAIGIRLSKDNARLLQDVGCKRLNIMLDGDAPGLRGAKAMSSKYESYFDEIKIIRIPDGKDPADLTKKQLRKIKRQLI